MKAKLKTFKYEYEVEYWDCGNSFCRKHQTQETANFCIAQRSLAASKRHRKRTDAELLEILKDHRSGTKTKEIAMKLGVSSSQASFIIKQAKQREGRLASGDPLEKLSVRAWHALRDNKLRTVEEVRAAFEAGLFKDMPNVGAGTVNELSKWLGDPANA